MSGDTSRPSGLFVFLFEGLVRGRRLSRSARAVTGLSALALGLWLGAEPAQAQAQVVCQNNLGGDGGATAGPVAVACGNISTASGVASSAYGSSSTASGFASSAYGVDSRASGTFSSAYGRASRAIGVASSAYGVDSQATGENSSAFGNGAQATHDNSAAFGNGATTTRANQQAFGTASNTYTMAGLTSDASKIAQGAPTKLVTTNEAGDLAAHTARELGLATLGDLSGLATKADLTGLQSQINGLAQRDKELADGIAMSLALAQPILLPGQTFAMRVGYGNFDGSSAVGVSGAGVLMRGHAGPTSSVVLDAGIGFAPDTSKAAGRVGLTFGW